MRCAGLVSLLLAAGLMAGCQTSKQKQHLGKDEWQLSFYTGKAHTFNSDIHVSQPSRGSDFTVRDVSFKDDSFTIEPPPNYGVRLTRWVGHCKTHGVQVDFQHAKAIARTNEVKTIVAVARLGTSKRR